MTRAVLDTNVVVAAERSSATGSPNREIMVRWRAGEFLWLYSSDTILEYIEKLLEHGIPEADVRRLVRALGVLAEKVEIKFFHLRRYPADPDDIVFVLCALNGRATHLVTYDGHLFEVAHEYPFIVCDPLRFLTALRRP